MIAHSNQALNDLFEKILDRDIAEHHMLRLGARAYSQGLGRDV